MANYKSEKFHFNAKAKVISTELSELRPFFGESVFGITSARTGKTAFFTFVTVHRDAENEALYWEYAPLTAEPNLKDWRVHLYND